MDFILQIVTAVHKFIICFLNKEFLVPSKTVLPIVAMLVFYTDNNCLINNCYFRKFSCMYNTLDLESGL